MFRPKSRASKNNNIIISLLQILENSETPSIHTLLMHAMAEKSGPATKALVVFWLSNLYKRLTSLANSCNETHLRLCIWTN